MRIKNLPKDQIETLIQAVAIRYRVKTDQINTTLIRQTLQAEFNNMFVNEFNEAFIKHCAGRFMISKEAEGNKPYGDLSCLFVCNVLKAFKSWKQAENAKPKLITPDKQLEMPKENIRDAYEFIKKVVDETNNLPIVANWNDAFLYMEQEGIIKIDLDEKIMFSEIVKEDLLDEIKFLKKERKNGYQDLIKILENKKLFAGELRKRYLQKYFEN